MPTSKNVPTKTFGVEPMLFRPTKRWLRSHAHKPTICHDDDCTCVWASFDDRTGRGFCIGFWDGKANHEETYLDIVSLCTVTWNFKRHCLECQQGSFHPQEALLIAMILNDAVVELFNMLPAYKTVTHKMLLAGKRQQKQA